MPFTFPRYVTTTNSQESIPEWIYPGAVCSYGWQSATGLCQRLAKVTRSSIPLSPLAMNWLASTERERPTHFLVAINNMNRTKPPLAFSYKVYLSLAGVRNFIETKYLFSALECAFLLFLCDVGSYFGAIQEREAKTDMTLPLRPPFYRTPPASGVSS